MLYSLRDFVKWQAPPIEPILLPDLLHKGSWMLLFGDQETYKSWAVMDLAWAVSTGTKWLGTWDTKKNNVLIINTEIPANMYQDRCIEMGKYKTVFPADMYVSTDLNLKLDTMSGKHSLEEWCAAVKPGLVIVDNLYRATQGDLNSGTGVNLFLDALSTIRERYNTAFCFVHHSRKVDYDPQLRTSLRRGVQDATGSKFIVNNANLIIEFQRYEDARQKGVPIIHAIREKASFSKGAASRDDRIMQYRVLTGHVPRFIKV